MQLSLSDSDYGFEAEAGAQCLCARKYLIALKRDLTWRDLTLSVFTTESIANAIDFLDAYNAPGIIELANYYGFLDLNIEPERGANMRRRPDRSRSSIGLLTADEDYPVPSTTSEPVRVFHLGALSPAAAVAVERQLLECSMSLAGRVLRDMERSMKAQRGIELILNFTTLATSGGTVGTMLAHLPSAAIILGIATVLATFLGVINKFLGRNQDLTKQQDKFLKAAVLYARAKRLLAHLSVVDATDGAHDEAALKAVIEEAESVASDMTAFAAGYGVAPLGDNDLS
jgi:hypothetical protein